MKLIKFPEQPKVDETYIIVLKNAEELEIKAFSVLLDDIQNIVMFAKVDGTISFVCNSDELAYACVVEKEDEVSE